ncbi:uncharacterized protein LOC143827433 [Paroedura picta]|uniref:uncharacterized protein LOC143827433 n=1 Tax=Paroedura picta TaxID=143630 RepID=UPI004056CCE7
MMSYASELNSIKEIFQSVGLLCARSFSGSSLESPEGRKKSVLGPSGFRENSPLHSGRRVPWQPPDFTRTAERCRGRPRDPCHVPRSSTAGVTEVPRAGWDLTGHSLMSSPRLLTERPTVRRALRLIPAICDKGGHSGLTRRLGAADPHWTSLARPPDSPRISWRSDRVRNT